MDQCLSEKDLDGFQRLFNKYWELVSYRKEGYTGNIADYDLICANIVVGGEKWSVIDYEWTTAKLTPPAAMPRWSWRCCSL